MVHENVGVYITWPAGKKDFPNFKKNVSRHLDTILRGTFLAVDPASNSLGWAVFENGKYKSSGTLKAPAKLPLPGRLQYMHDNFKDLKGHKLLVVEAIRSVKLSQVVRYAVGMTLVASRAEEYIECPIPVWKAVAAASSTYTKTDEQDAIMIGASAVFVAMEIEND